MKRRKQRFPAKRGKAATVILSIVLVISAMFVAGAAYKLISSKFKDEEEPTQSVEETTEEETSDEPIHIHNAVLDPREEPTCTTPGKTGGAHCSDCEEVISAQEEIPAKGHTLVVEYSVEPTCTTQGSTKKVSCSVCEEVIESSEEVPALGHNEVAISGCAETCTADGLSDGVQCTRCKEMITPQEVIPKTGHNVVEFSGTEPTCAMDGYGGGTECADCGIVLSGGRLIEATRVHTYASYKDMTCTVCGYQASTGLEYENRNGELFVIGRGTVTDATIVIPENVEGISVVGIATEAFKDQSDITRIWIPESVKYIEADAFYGTGYV